MSDISSLDSPDMLIGPDIAYREVLPWEPRYWKESLAKNYCYSAALTIPILLFFLMATYEARHWMILPIGLCGIIAGSDIVRWFRDEIDVFDLKFLVAFFIYLNCFMAPLMHLYYDVYGGDLYVPNWPQWFGYMGFVNLGGIILFKVSQLFFYIATKPTYTCWQIDPGRIFMMGVPAICISATTLAIIHIFFGGLVKVLGRIEIASGAGAYTHFLSILRMFADPFVPLLMMLIVCWLYINKPDRSRSFSTVLILLTITFVFQFFAVGLRGSRGALLGGTLVIAVIAHFTVKPINKKWIFIGMAFLLIFVYLYDFRKKIGLEGWAAFYDAEARESFAYRRGGVGFHTMVLGDLTRADVEALMLYNLTERRSEIGYSYLKGETYAMAVLTFIPRAIWPNKPRDPKREAGYQALYGTAGESTRQYGLAGEAMLNFGPIAVLPAYFLFGAVLGFIRRKIYTLSFTDVRLFLAPLLIIVVMRVIIYDSVGLFFELIVRGALPFIVFYFGSTKIKATQA